MNGARYRPENLMRCNTSLEGRNLTNVWRIPPPRNGAGHFAAMPTALVERPIAMTCPEFVTEQGPRRRIVESIEYDEGRTCECRLGQYTQAEGGSWSGTLSSQELRQKSGRQDSGKVYIPKHPRTTGWTYPDLPSTPGIVLDPFCGIGSTGEVAIKLGRRFIGIELYREYADRAMDRCRKAVAALADSVRPGTP